MSIRLRLTLLYSAILAVVLLTLSILLYATVSQMNLRVIENTLVEEAERLLSTQLVQFNQIILPASRFAAPETYIQTRNLAGDITDKTLNLGDYFLPLTPEGLAALRSGRPVAETTVIEGGRLLIFSRPILFQNQVVGIVQVARSLAGYDELLATLQRVMLIGSVVVLAIAFGTGWLLAGAALRPIHRITRTAQAIGAERDFGRRIGYTGPNDELGRLATTFNAMLSELQAAYSQAEQALQAQRRFVGDASHELRTPLTTLRGNIALLQREPPIREEDRTAVLVDMADECDRLSRLVRDLLTLARADAGRLLPLEPVEIRPLIEECLRQIQPLASKRSVQAPVVVEATVRGNRDALKQVLLILLDNAIKFTPEDGKVRVSAVQEDGQLAIAVRDNGRGIDPTALPHIFDRFFRSDSARTGGGAGLGLAIAKTLVEAQQGSIRVASTPGEGSTFSVMLTLAG